jgi:hypothetical protein
MAGDRAVEGALARLQLRVEGRGGLGDDVGARDLLAVLLDDEVVPDRRIVRELEPDLTGLRRQRGRLVLQGAGRVGGDLNRRGSAGRRLGGRVGRLVARGSSPSSSPPQAARANAATASINANRVLVIGVLLSGMSSSLVLPHERPLILTQRRTGTPADVG